MATVKKTKNFLKFSRPASWWGSTWREALPTGNGVIGASVYGGAGHDVIMINHSDLWWQGHVGVLQDVADKLKDVRKKMEENSFEDAENVFSNALMQKGYHPRKAYPLPLCDFHVKMPIDKAPKEYVRTLNMENGEVGVSFKDGYTKYERQLFVSRVPEVDALVYEITKVGQKTITVNFSFDMHDKFNARTLNAVSKLPDGVNIKYEDYFMYFSARSDDGTEFGAVAHIRPYGGSQTVDAQKGITIKGADRVWVIIKPFISSQREKEWKNLKPRLSTIAKSTYDKLLKEHTSLHAKWFGTADIDLGGEQRDEFADNLLDDAFKGGELSATLLEKLWAFGRFLMITGSSPQSQPMPPYGVWCGDFKAENSAITADGALQTTYSHVCAGGLAEYVKSVFTYYDSVIDDLRKNSSRIYGCRGLLVPSEMAHGTGAFGDIDGKTLHFTGVAGWICRLFYDYYLYTDDVKFLKEKALPFMRETAMFYGEFFKVKGDGLYESSPSYSPASFPGNYADGEGLKIARNSTVDFAIAKDLLTNLIEGSEAAGVYKNEIGMWKDMLTRIPAYKMNEDGTVREYIDGKFADNYAQPSTAMFYPVYPACEVDEDKPELYKAFLAAAKKKCAFGSEKQTSVSLSQFASVFARFGEGDLVMDLLTAMVRTMSMNNLILASSDWRGMGITGIDVWATFSVVANMGLTNALQEMLAQSSKNTVKLLPALPSKLDRGEISGIATRTGAEIVSMGWDKKKGVCIVKLKSKKSKQIDLKLPCGAKKYKAVGKEKVDLENGVVSGLELPAGKVVSLDIRF